MDERLSAISQTNKVDDLQNYFSWVNMFNICYMFSMLCELILNTPVINVHVMPKQPNIFLIPYDIRVRII